MSSCQLVVIGAGPGGYAAAFRAADLGLNVTLIDTDSTMGGVCLNRGCIPSKALLHAAHVITNSTEARAMGIEFNEPDINIEKLRAWKNGIVTRLTGGLAQLAKARQIPRIQGHARFLDPRTLQITKSDGTVETLAFEKAILATGSRPATLPFLAKGPRVWDSTDALALSEVPTSLLVIGGGYIGLELGSAYAALGCAVSVVEVLPSLLSSADKDLADIVARRLKKSFHEIICGTRITKADVNEDGVHVTFTNNKGENREAVYSHVLMSVGRTPNTEDLGLDKAGIPVSEQGFIQVDKACRTAQASILAIGDVTGQPMLAHKASAEARAAVETAAGHAASFNPACIPSVIFTDPELAWCGVTEQDALTAGRQIVISKFPWTASGRAMTLGRTDGLTKIIADAATGRIIGAGIAGVNAGELIAECALAIETGVKAEDLELTIHPHPTLAETLMETAEGLFGTPVHMFKTKK